MHAILMLVEFYRRPFYIKEDAKGVLFLSEPSFDFFGEVNKTVKSWFSWFKSTLESVQLSIFC